MLIKIFFLFFDTINAKPLAKLHANFLNKAFLKFELKKQEFKLNFKNIQLLNFFPNSFTFTGRY